MRSGCQCGVFVCFLCVGSQCVCVRLCLCCCDCVFVLLCEYVCLGIVSLFVCGSACFCVLWKCKKCVWKVLCLCLSELLFEWLVCVIVCRFGFVSVYCAVCLVKLCVPVMSVCHVVVACVWLGGCVFVCVGVWVCACGCFAISVCHWVGMRVCDSVRVCGCVCVCICLCWVKVWRCDCVSCDSVFRFWCVNVSVWLRNCVLWVWISRRQGCVHGVWDFVVCDCLSVWVCQYDIWLCSCVMVMCICLGVWGLLVRFCLSG